MALTSGQGTPTVKYAVQFLDHINYIKDLAIRTVSWFIATRSWWLRSVFAHTVIAFCSVNVTYSKTSCRAASLSIGTTLAYRAPRLHSTTGLRRVS